MATTNERDLYRLHRVGLESQLEPCSDEVRAQENICAVQGNISHCRRVPGKGQHASRLVALSGTTQDLTIGSHVLKFWLVS
jgi:hypothetical protein